MRIPQALINWFVVWVAISNNSVSVGVTHVCMMYVWCYVRFAKTGIPRFQKKLLAAVRKYPEYAKAQQENSEKATEK